MQIRIQTNVPKKGKLAEKVFEADRLYLLDAPTYALHVTHRELDRMRFKIESGCRVIDSNGVFRIVDIEWYSIRKYPIITLQPEAA